MSCTVENLGRPQTVPAYASIKDDSWRQEVVTDIKINTKAVDRNDKNIFYGKNVDPLTNLRDILRTLSNQESFKYMRQCRLIVAKLKECWVELNDEIKSLSKSKEYLESAIDHIRKDIIINQETIDNRVNRPPREIEQDGVDEILLAEKQNLLILKRNLEIALKPILVQLYRLDETREGVFKLGRERSRATDLICQCLTQSMRAYDASANEKNKKRNQITSSLTKSMSTFSPQGHANAVTIGPLSAFTPESIEIMQLAAALIAEGKDLRKKS